MHCDRRRFEPTCGKSFGKGIREIGPQLTVRQRGHRASACGRSRWVGDDSAGRCLSEPAGDVVGPERPRTGVDDGDLRSDVVVSHCTIVPAQHEDGSVA